MSLLCQFFAELLGSAMLLTIVVGSGIMGEQLAQGNMAIALLANSIATGCGLFVLISLWGPLSGAHFNPVVSLRAWWRGELTRSGLSAYIMAQIGGAVLGVWLAHLMFELPIMQTGVTVRSGLGLWCAEFIATFGLILCISLAERFHKERIAALVACYITAAYWFTASTSFANPAVTLARALTDTFAGIAPTSVPAFISAQLAGLVAGMFVAQFLLASKSARTLQAMTAQQERI